MARRSTPPGKVADHVFPVRVRFVVPEMGLGDGLLQMHRWLEEKVGRGRYFVGGSAGAGGRPKHVSTVHFNDTATADAFVREFGLRLPGARIEVSGSTRSRPA